MGPRGSESSVRQLLEADGHREAGRSAHGTGSKPCSHDHGPVFLVESSKS